MLQDGVNLVQGSGIANMHIESGASFPLNPVDGQEFHLTTVVGNNAVGIYSYELSSTSWVLAGDITSVVAGTNLTGGGTRGAVTLNLDPTFAASVELLINKDIDGVLTANSDTKYPSQKAVKTYVDSQVSTINSSISLAELLSNKSSDTLLGASNTLYPTQNAVKTYVDAASALSELLSNKSTSTSLGTSNTLYPTQLAVKTYVDGLMASVVDDRGSYDASVNVWPSTGGRGAAGAVLKGDFWYVSVAGTLGGTAVGIGDCFRALVDAPGQTSGNWSVLEANIGYVPENAANKSTSTALGTSDALFPTQNAVKTYVDNVHAVNANLTGDVTSVGNATTIAAASYNKIRLLSSDAVVGGTVNAITLTPSTAITSYASAVGQMFLGKVSGANTTAVTVAISGLAALSTTMGSVAVPVGGLVANNYYWFLIESATSVRITPFDAVSSNGDTVNGTLSFTSGGISGATVNGNTITTGTGVLTLAAAKTLTVNNTITLSGTDASTLNIGTGGTLGTGAYVAAVSSTTTFVAQTGTTYTFVDSDMMYGYRSPVVVTFNNAAAQSATVPTNASVPCPTGTRIDCIGLGAGKVTFVPASGVTIISSNSYKAIGGQSVAVSLLKSSTADTWYLIGSLQA